MSRFLLIILLTAISATFSHPMLAHKKIVKQALRLDSMMLHRYRNANIDTTYVTRPQTRFTLSARLNTAGSKFEVEGMDDGKHLHSKLSSDFKQTLSVAANYLGVTVALSINPAKLLGKYRDYEIGLVYYGKRFGGDLFYQDAKNYTGYYEEDGLPRIEFPADIFQMRTLNASGYYVFNHRRFSYPAAMTQGYIQRRSAGSFMLAASAQAQQGHYQGEDEMKLRITNIGLGGGYGYNFVPAKRWLLHISALPTIIAFNHTSLTYNDSRVPLKYHFPDVIITTRAALVYQIKKNQFAALSGVFYYSDFGSNKRLDIQNNKWRMRVTYGYRL